MIDTVKIAQTITRKQFDRLFQSESWKKSYDPDTSELAGLRNKDKGKQNPYLSAFMSYGAYYLSASVSLPTLYHGSNARLLSQSQTMESLELLSKYVSTRSWLEFDAASANVWEVDFAQDVLFGNIPLKTITKEISAMDIPYFEPGMFKNSTAYFNSGKARTWCFYDKHQNCKDKKFSAEDIRLTKGILRLEYRFNTTEAVKYLVARENLKDRQARTLFQQELSDRLIDPIKERILTLTKYAGAQEKINVLTNAFGGRKATTLISHLTRRDLFGNKYYENDSLDITKSVYYNNQKDCRSVGIYSLFGE
jgi:hypothetical protein